MGIEFLPNLLGLGHLSIKCLKTLTYGIYCFLIHQQHYHCVLDVSLQSIEHKICTVSRRD